MALPCKPSAPAHKEICLFLLCKRRTLTDPPQRALNGIKSAVHPMCLKQHLALNISVYVIVIK